MQLLREHISDGAQILIQVFGEGRSRFLFDQLSALLFRLFLCCDVCLNARLAPKAAAAEEIRLAQERAEVRIPIAIVGVSKGECLRHLKMFGKENAIVGSKVQFSKIAIQMTMMN